MCLSSLPHCPQMDRDLNKTEDSGWHQDLRPISPLACHFTQGNAPNHSVPPKDKITGVSLGHQVKPGPQ